MTALAPLTDLERLLLRWGTSGLWETSRLLTDHAAAVATARTGHHGGHFSAPGMERWWTQTTDRGIALHKRLTDLGGTPDHLLTWTRIRDHAAALPAGLLEELAAADTAMVDHMTRWRPWEFGPHVDRPLTREQTEREDAYLEWQVGYFPEGHALRARWRVLVDKACTASLSVPAEPAQGDLFDLLVVSA